MNVASSAKNYLSVKEKVRHHAIKCNRDPNEITIVAVSKGYSWDQVAPVYQAGCRLFGENRLQEALEKKEKAAENDIQWHFIGTLQTNKVRQSVGQFALIHSVDSVELAEKINQVSLEKECVSAILLQVNVSGEKSKHGLSCAQWKQQISKMIHLPAVKVEGLMTMAPLTQNQDAIRNCFGGLRHLREELVAETGQLMPHLSMGMSQDYPIAIEEGATLLRIGNSIFSR